MQFAESAQTDRRRRMVLYACAFLSAWCVLAEGMAVAGGLVRVSDGKSSWEGKVIALNSSVCSLIDRQGQLVQVNIDALSSFEKLSSRFTPLATSELRDSLRNEFTGGYEVSGTTHYLVCGPAGKARRYADLFEDIYRDVERFYRVGGFKVTKPDVPLIAIVFRSQKEFVQYCLKDQVPPSPGLRGYYSLRTNRVALFDDTSLLSSREPTGSDIGDVAAFAGLSGSTAGTIIHETTHQVGYNLGIHSRLGGTPAWVVEGLATVLEPDGMRSSSGRRTLDQRWNPERVNWFRQKHRPSRPMGNLAKLIASDEHFFRNTLNSYSESWAFTFFLMENASRRRDFVTYLKRVEERDAARNYTAAQRLADFQAVFGDISRVEIDFIRFMDRM